MQIARLAMDGQANAGIAAQMFISPAPSSTTCTKFSPSSASPRVTSSAALFSRPRSPRHREIHEYHLVA